MVTAILALSLVRARKLLVNSVAETIAASDLARFFAPEIAARLRRTEIDPIAGQGVRTGIACCTPPSWRESWGTDRFFRD
jgi:adenylate cyclase